MRTTFQGAFLSFLVCFLLAVSCYGETTSGTFGFLLHNKDVSCFVCFPFVFLDIFKLQALVARFSMVLASDTRLADAWK